MAWGDDLSFLLSSTHIWTQPVKPELWLTSAQIPNVNIWQTEDYIFTHLCKHSLFLSSPEQHPSIRNAHHHRQTPHRIRGIRGNVLNDWWCVFEFFLLVNNSGGWRARAALYSLWSSASIIKDWYLLRRAGVMGGEARGRGKWKRGKTLNSDGCLHRLS